MTREEDYTISDKWWQEHAEKFHVDCLQVEDIVDRAFWAGAEWADAHPHWLSVEDELPKINPNGSEWEYSDDVIVALKDGSIAVGRYERYNSTGEHYWMLYGVDKDLIVTHWMPRLQAPVLSNSENTGKDLKGGEK